MWLAFFFFFKSNVICFLSAKHTLLLIGEVEFELIIFALWQDRGKQARRLTLYVIYMGLGCSFFNSRGIFHQLYQWQLVVVIVFLT